MRRVGESTWVLHPMQSLDGDTVDALRDAFLEVVDSGAQHVLVDLSAVDVVAAAGVETILTMADLMRGRDATLWLAARSPDGRGHALRAIDCDARGALRGVSAALDAAIDVLPREGGRGPQRSSETFTRR